MSSISSRTPDGLPNQCPVCLKQVRIQPSDPTGDAPCPHCGSLLWFVAGDDGFRLFDKSRFRVSAETPSGETTLRVGHHVRVSHGAFESFEGTVAAIDTESNQATVLITIFGQTTPVELSVEEIQPA